MFTKLAISLNISGVLVNTFPRWYRFSPNDDINGAMFLKWQSMSFVLWALAALFTNRENRVERIFWCASFGLALSNFWDEYNDRAISTNTIEIAVVITIVLCTVAAIAGCPSRKR